MQNEIRVREVAPSCGVLERSLNKLSMAGGASLLDLPLELLEMITSQPSLSLLDICRLSLTCRRLYDVITFSWAKIALSRWEGWGKCEAKTNEEWRTLCCQRHCCEIKLASLMNQTISRGVRQYLIDEEEMENYNDLMGPRGCSAAVMDCVLMDILDKPIKEANISHQFYGLFLYEYLKRTELRQKWKAFLALPHQEQLLMQGAIYIDQWIHPLNDELSQANIDSQLDDITLQVVSHLLQQHNGTDDSSDTASKYPRLHDDSGATLHLERSVATVNKLRLPRNTILEAINDVLYLKIGFRPATPDDYYNINNSLIHQVLKRRCGIPITLCAVHQAIAHRLGITLLPVNFPTHFLLKAPRDSKDGEVFIDAYGRGQLLSQNQCLSLLQVAISVQPSMFEHVEPYRAIIRMVANIYSRGHMLGLTMDISRHWLETRKHWGPIVLPSALSLQLSLCWMSPHNDFSKQVASDAAGIALDLKFNLKQVEWVLSDMLVHGSNLHILTKLQRARTMSERKKKVLADETRVKRRDPNTVIFNIGRIMKHIIYDYRCVIYGWDTKCNMSDAWIQQMGVNSLTHGPNQPFYDVLVEDGTNRYAAQENLQDCPQSKICPILHWEVGKYFQSFTGSHYVPNHALLEKYPD